MIWSDLTTFLRFCFSLIDLKYSLKLVATKSFTSSSAKNFKYHQSLEYRTLCFIIRTKFFIKLAMMKNYDQSVEIFHNPNWPYISDHCYRISIIGGSGSGKGDVLLNLTNIKD